MQHIIRIVAVLFLTWSAALAQDEPPKEQPFLVPILEKMERATTENEEGLLVWAEHQPERCVNCKGTKKMQCRVCFRFDDGECADCPECHNTRETVCRLCAGEGTMADILERAPCPTCGGAAVTVCFICHGKGQFLVQGGGDKAQKCMCCAGVGGFPCGTCGGARYVAPPKMKPSVAEGKLKDLREALEELEKVSEALATFETTQDGRKDIKVMGKVLAPARKFFPALKDAAKDFETVSKDQAKGANWKHYASAVEESAMTAKHTLEYFIKHQRRVLELCITRAEHNEQVEMDKKDKKG